MLLDKEKMHFKNDKHLFWNRIICKKDVLQRCFAISMWYDKWRRLAVWVRLDLEFYSSLYNSSISLLICNIAVSYDSTSSFTVILLQFWRSIPVLTSCSNSDALLQFWRPTPVLMPCSSSDALLQYWLSASTQEPCPSILSLRFVTANWSGSLPDSVCSKKFVSEESFWTEEAFRMSLYWVKRC